MTTPTITWQAPKLYMLMQSQYSTKSDVPEYYEYLQGRPVGYFLTEAAALEELSATRERTESEHRVQDIQDTGQRRELDSEAFAYWDDEERFGLAFWIEVDVPGSDEMRGEDVVVFVNEMLQIVDGDNTLDTGE
ncbi:Nn.00g063290.m01.CDS01 [Neocucurbitaria sp. VM-36]